MVDDLWYPDTRRTRAKNKQHLLAQPSKSFRVERQTAKAISNIQIEKTGLSDLVLHASTRGRDDREQGVELV